MVRMVKAGDNWGESQEVQGFWGAGWCSTPLLLLIIRRVGPLPPSGNSNQMRVRSGAPRMRKLVGEILVLAFLNQKTRIGLHCTNDVIVLAD